MAKNKKIAKYDSEYMKFIMKVLTFGGVVILFVIAFLLSKYFFVDKSYIKVNMSTDKKLEYITIEGQEELIATQKYVSDLDYSMRYDIEKFKVLKAKNQDLYKFLNDERVMVFVSKADSPSNCTSTGLDNNYNNCFIRVDDYTEEYYISSNGITYKVMVRTPNTTEYQEGVRVRIQYMLNSFEMNA